jgi:hypothetical protein
MGEVTRFTDERCRHIVRAAAHRCKNTYSKEWLRRDERGIWEKRARELLEETAAKVEELQMDPQAVDKEIAVALAVAARGARHPLSTEPAPAAERARDGASPRPCRRRPVTAKTKPKWWLIHIEGQLAYVVQEPFKKYVEAKAAAEDLHAAKPGVYILVMSYTKEKALEKVASQSPMTRVDGDTK